MLIKNSELLIEKSNPFQNDCLDRKQSINDLTNLLRTATQPFVLSIEAPWGWGKTTFINMWRAFLESENQPCLYFNAWVNDFADDPLIAFISEMNSLLLGIKDKNKRNTVEKTLRKTQKIGEAIFKKSVPIILRIATQGILDSQAIDLIKNSSDELGELVEQTAEDRIEVFEKNKLGINSFKESLSNFIKQVSSSHSNQQPLVIFIDELDRCRPDFALSLLERMKHLFNLEGIIFVLSIDRQQLNSSLKAIYGSGINTEGYLRRFIDLRYVLPVPSTKQFCDLLYKRFDLKNFFDERRKLVNSQIDAYDTEGFLEAFSEIMTKFKFSLRAQEQCMTEINIIFRTTGPRFLLYSQLLVFLVAIKNYREDIYENLKQIENVDLDQILESVHSVLKGGDFFDKYFEPFISANIIRNFSDEDEPNKTIQAFLEKLNNSNEEPINNPDVYRAKRILEFYRQRNSFSDRRKKISHIISRIENLGGYLT